jgi:choline dehydrogenase-like flavoprotein
VTANPHAGENLAEVVVIGSGPGGATSAHLLAEHGKDVLILEEGSSLPLESCRPFSIQEMTQKYRAGGLNPTVGNAKIAFAEGRVVGGGSEINSALYHRTPPEMLERWRCEFQVRDTGEEALRPHFEYCEQALHVGTSPVPAPLASRKLAEGAQRLGWRAMEVPRWFKFEAVEERKGLQGVRQSMSKTFLPRALRAGARLRPETRAQRLQRSGNGWLVSAETAGRTTEIRANAVFVCGGAVQTPLLLRRSGIRRNCGNSLAMHPTVKVVAVFDEEVNHENLGVPVHQVKEFAPRLSFGCSISSPPYLALALADQPGFADEVRRRWRHMAIYYAALQGPATGRVRSVFGCSDPLIRYHLTPPDLRDLSAGLRRLCQLLLAAGARRVYPSLAGAQPIDHEDQLSTIPAMLPPDRSNLMTIHLFSSCPMGEDQTRCVTDSMGRVHGVPNLLVNDASLIPTAPGVNPQGTVMALAHRNTMNFLQKH